MKYRGLGEERAQSRDIRLVANMPDGISLPPYDTVRHDRHQCTGIMLGERARV